MLAKFLLLSICAFIVALIVLPPWFSLRYKHKKSAQRVIHLENLLDKLQPDWRKWDNE